MQLQIVHLRNMKEFPALSSFNIGIGIHTGKVILGTVGDETRMDVTGFKLTSKNIDQIVISDAVNTASRLENLTKFFQVHTLTSADSLNVCDQFRCSI